MNQLVADVYYDMARFSVIRFGNCMCQKPIHDYRRHCKERNTACYREECKGYAAQDKTKLKFVSYVERLHY